MDRVSSSQSILTLAAHTYASTGCHYIGHGTPLKAQSHMDRGQHEGGEAMARRAAWDEGSLRYNLPKSACSVNTLFFILPSCVYDDTIEALLRGWRPGGQGAFRMLQPDLDRLR